MVKRSEALKCLDTEGLSPDDMSMNEQQPELPTESRLEQVIMQNPGQQRSWAGLFGYGRAEHQLESEQQQHQRTKLELQETALRLQKTEEAFKEESSMHIQTQLELQNKQQEVDAMRQRWREAASQLDRLLHQGRSANQLTDDEILLKARSLRFSIRNFALQFFGDEIKDIAVDQETLDFFCHYAKLPSNIVEPFLGTPSLRPMLVRALLWQIVLLEFSGKYRWAPPECASMKDMGRLLMPQSTASGHPSHEAYRDFHTWRAKTSSLILDAMERDPAEAQKYRQSICTHYARPMSKYLRRCSTSDRNSVYTRLHDLIEKVLDLDANFSTQVAVVGWREFAPRHSVAFISQQMELERGQAHDTTEGLRIQFALSPLLLKQGKSSGEEYDSMAVLLKSEVVAEPSATRTSAPDESHSSQSKRDHGRISKD